MTQITSVFTLLTALVLLMLSVAPAYAEDTECGLFGSEYVPQNLKLEKSYNKDRNLFNRTLSFMLRIEKGDIGGPIRNAFLNFDAYDLHGKKVSTMRLSDAWSNGISVQTFSSYWGMFCDFNVEKDEADCQEMKPNSIGFRPIGVGKDMSQQSIMSAPPLLIFPNTLTELTHNSFRILEDWDKYIKFYTPERVYPDFRGYDFWVRTKCGEADTTTKEKSN